MTRSQRRKTPIEPTVLRPRAVRDGGDARVLAYRGKLSRWLARYGSLRFAPSVSGCHAVNVQLN
jgi:hypothetical protein